MKTISKYRKLKNWNTYIVRSVEDSKEYAALRGDYLSPKGLIRSDLLDKIEKIKKCSTVIELKRIFDKNENTGILEERIEVINSNYCQQHIVCPICADRVQSKRRARLMEAIKAAAEKYAHAYMIVFTIQDDPDLASAIRKLKESIKNFRLKGQKRGGKYSFGQWRKIRASVLSYEIKRGDGSGLWHVHAHAIAFSDLPLNNRIYNKRIRSRIVAEYGRGSSPVPKQYFIPAIIRTVDVGGRPVPASVISKEWWESTGGTSINIDVRPLKRESHAAVADSAKEVLKYMSKLNHNNPGDIITILESTYNDRFFEVTGDFRGIDANEYEYKVDTDTITLLWNPSAHQYDNPDYHDKNFLEKFDPSDARKSKGLGLQAKLLAKYRLERRSIFECSIRSVKEKINDIQSRKEMFRQDVKRLWARLFDLPCNAPPVPDPVQLSLFPS